MTRPQRKHWHTTRKSCVYFVIVRLITPSFSAQITCIANKKHILAQIYIYLSEILLLFLVDLLDQRLDCIR